MFRTNAVRICLRVHQYTSAAPSQFHRSRNSVFRTNAASVNFRAYSQLVATAFASLKQQNDQKNAFETNEFDKILNSSENIEDIFAKTKELPISKSEALKVISLLNKWVSEKKIDVKDFEKDSRFLSICSHLNLNDYKKALRFEKNQKNDLSTVLNYFGEDEAAKIISRLSTPQMIKILMSLGSSKRRSLSLLNSLSYHMCNSKDVLSVKQCSDILFSLAVLNYPDNSLLQRIRNDICENLRNYDNKTSIIGSILKSLGYLKCFDMDLLDMLSQWILNNFEKCRTQEFVSLVTTLACLNYKPSNSEVLFAKVLPKLKLSEMQSQKTWIDVVWSLTVLDLVTKDLIKSTLDPKFLKNLSELSPAIKVKLLNINAAAKYLIKNYDGPVLKEKQFETAIEYSKDKLQFSELIVESLMNLLPSSQFIKTNVTTDMGFNIDAECLFDETRNPAKLTKTNYSKKDYIKVAFLFAYYHDVCANDRSKIIGSKHVSKMLLEASGHKVIVVPYSDFHFGNKLSDRIKYLNQKLQDAVK